MPIIGKLVKKTTEFSTKRNAFKGLDFNDQLVALAKLLKFSAKTRFGQYHDFNSVLASEDLVKAFQAAIPYTDYDDLYNKWLYRAIAGEKNITWPGVIKYFALSSGTTGSPSKRIPVTKQMIRSFQRTTIKQFAATSRLDLSPVFYQKSFLAVGGSTKLEHVGNHIEGDLSGILKKHTSVVMLPLTKPDPKTAAIKDWNKKLDKMVEMAPHWDISTVAGIPSWCIMLLERIVAKYQLNNIHDMWPNFELYVYGGVYIEPYLKRFEKLCGKKVHTLNTYLSSEGYFAYQNRPDTHTMQLLLNTGIFYEFVPFNTDNFDENGNIYQHAQALTVDEVAVGEDYALIISTNAGLWRYMIGDLVQFTDVERREIKISGRIKQYLSLVGEHLSLDNINVAIQSTIEELGVSIPEFCLYADVAAQAHFWYFGTDQQINGEKVMETVDKHLCALNDDYRSSRKYDTLKSPIPKCIPTNNFYQYMELNGRLGSQNKFPRVMNQHQSKDWRLFLGI